MQFLAQNSMFYVEKVKSFSSVPSVCLKIFVSQDRLEHHSLFFKTSYFLARLISSIQIDSVSTILIHKLFLCRLSKWQLVHERSGGVDEDAGGYVLRLHPVLSAQCDLGLGTILCPRIQTRWTLCQRVPGYPRGGHRLCHVQLIH